MKPRELFLSHAGADHRFTRKVVQVLREFQVPVWYSETHLVGAQEWQDRIGVALKRCDWFAVIVSPKALQSMWVRREVTYALRQRRLEKRIVPILYKACDLEQMSWVLPSVQFVDFTRSFKKGCRELLRIWRIAYSGS